MSIDDVTFIYSSLILWSLTCRYAYMMHCLGNMPSNGMLEGVYPGVRDRSLWYLNSTEVVNQAAHFAERGNGGFPAFMREARTKALPPPMDDIMAATDDFEDAAEEFVPATPHSEEPLLIE